MLSFSASRTNKSPINNSNDFMTYMTRQIFFPQNPRVFQKSQDLNLFFLFPSSAFCLGTNETKMEIWAASQFACFFFLRKLQ